jgi:hypothetical protein
LFSVLAACGGDTAVTTEAASTGASESSTGETGDAASTGEPPTTSEGASSTGETGDDPPPPALEFARGVRLTRVTATQAVQVEIVHDGVEVPADAYAVRLISRRKTVLRADWSLHAEFVPRELIGRLTIWTPEGDTRVDDFKVMVDGPSNDGDLLRTFSWQLPPEFVRPGLEYRIEALEPDPSLAAGEVSDPPPVLPLASRGTLAVADHPMHIKVLLVPIQHEFEGMTCVPEIGEADLDAMRRWIEQHNPVESAELTVGEPLVYTESIGTEDEGFVPLLTELGIRRAADKPPDNLYYYGLITSCDGYPPGLLGQAYAITDGPGPEFAFQRIATGRYSGSGMAARDTFVHEVGHSQGRYHIRCTGGEAGVDNSYPHTNGRIGLWGYGIHDTQLRSPTGFRDYMSYCNASFVSDFGWELTYDYIRELSSWDAGPPPPPPDLLLVGTVTAGGTARFWTTRGTLPTRGRGPGTVVELEVDGATVAVPAAAAAMPDADAITIAAPLPPAWSAATGLRLRVDGQLRASAPRHAVTELEAP